MTFTFDDITEASSKLQGKAIITPLIESSLLNEIAGARVFVKAETLQKSGSFKFRGATNRMLYLSPEERQRGVVAFSSGNHALAVSLAALELDTHAVVLMPNDAPRVKIEGARGNGAEVVLYDRSKVDREAICAQLCSDRGLTLIPPYDDYHVMAGAGTSALEAFRQLPPDSEVDAIFVNCSGGGLTAGWATVANHLLPTASVFAVEPEAFDDTCRSLRKGNRVANAEFSGSICDALLVRSPGELTFEVLKERGVVGVGVSDAQILNAMQFAFRTLKLVVEPSGAAALAAVLNKKAVTAKGSDILLIVSGGNVDPMVFAQCL